MASLAEELSSNKLYLPLFAGLTGVLGDNEVKQVEEKGAIEVEMVKLELEEETKQEKEEKRKK